MLARLHFPLDVAGSRRQLKLRENGKRKKKALSILRAPVVVGKRQKTKDKRQGGAANVRHKKSGPGIIAECITLTSMCTKLCWQ